MDKITAPKSLSVLAGDFEIAYGQWKLAAMLLQRSPVVWVLRDDGKRVATKPDILRRAVKHALGVMAETRGAVVDWYRQRAESISGPSVTHARVAARFELLSKRWAAERATAIERPKSRDGIVWARQYEFESAVQAAEGEPDAEARLQEILVRFSADFLCDRKTLLPPADAVAEDEVQRDAGGEPGATVESVMTTDHAVVLRVLERAGRAMVQVDIASDADNWFDHHLHRTTVGKLLEDLRGDDLKFAAPHGGEGSRKGDFITTSGLAWLKQHPPSQDSD